MNNLKIYSKNELEDAKFAINSTISKCEKSLLKIITDKSPQKTLLIRRINALKISVDLIERELLRFYGQQETTTR